MTTVTDADRNMARDWNYECRHCSEYDGDFEADLAEAFARHRQAAILEGMEIGLSAAISRLDAADVEAALRNLNTPAGRAAILAAHTRAMEEV